MPKEIKVTGGLLPTPKDSRDLLGSAVLDLPLIAELPKEYRLTTRGIKDQGNTDKCSAFGTTTISEPQEGIILNPHWQFAQTKKIMGGDPDEWGADIRSACKSLLVGSLPEVFAEGNQSRKWQDWATELDEKAYEHRKKTFVKVSGRYDLFDNIRATLWANKEEKQGIVTGVIWRDGWISAIIPKEEMKGQFGHLIPIIGWKEIHGESHLIIQNSYGKSFGDYGLNYFPREVVNRDFTFGSYTFVDIDLEEARAKQKGFTLFDRLREKFSTLVYSYCTT